MRRQFLLLMTALVAVAGCDDERPAGVTAPMPRDGAAAFLTVSDPRAAVGSEVTVVAVVRQAVAGHAVGAFTAALRYDATALKFAGEQELAGGMRALNPQSGVIRAAGASPEGFAAGELFAIRFTVLAPNALETLALDVSELSSISFDNQMAKLQVHRSFFPAPRR